MNKLLMPLFISSFLLSGFMALVPESRAQSMHLKASDLPAPYATKSTSRSAQKITRTPEMRPKMADGFTVSLYAEGLGHARNFVISEVGDVYIAQSNLDIVSRLRDTNWDNVADERTDILYAFNRPHGLALRGNQLFVADLDAIWSVERLLLEEKPTQLTAPDALGTTNGHWTRNIAFSPDGTKIYASIGSENNIAEEALPRASLQEFTFDSSGLLSNQQTFAHGLRNPVGLGFHPLTGKLYTVVNERDGMGDGLVPDYFTAVEKNDFFGWPYAYIGKNPMPEFASKNKELVAKSKVPDVLFRSHSAPLSFTFLTEANVPDSWKDDVLVALHGSWNAGDPVGYKVVRVHFEVGKPTGVYEDFATGFRLNPQEKNKAAKVWGRPVGLGVMPDGSILVSDDLGGTIWRMTFDAGH